MNFELSQYARDGYVVIELHGELDVGTVPVLKGGLHGPLNSPAPRIILDLAGLTFIDSSALTVLVSSDRQARKLGGALALASPRRIVARVLSLTALDQYFPVYPTVSEAVADGQAALD